MKVAVLEAGDEESVYPMTDIPLALLDLQLTGADWAYKTVPQNYSCGGMRNEVLLIFFFTKPYSIYNIYRNCLVIIY